MEVLLEGAIRGLMFAATAVAVGAGALAFIVGAVVVFGALRKQN